jgi:transcriptional regulator with XRE-family HTH domain
MELFDLIMLNLNRFLNEKNLSLSKLAFNLGINKQNFYAYRDRRAKIPLETLQLISNRYAVPMTYWFESESKIPMVNEDQAKYGIQQLGEMNQVISILERQLNKKDDQIIFLQDQLIKAQGTRKNSEPAH